MIYQTASRLFTFVLHSKDQSQREYAIGSVLERTRGGRLRELDGWRAVSVLMVTFFHIWAYQYQTRVPHIFGLSRAINSSGDVAVKMFFMISGFLICRLLLREESSYGSVSLKGFYYRRIFRILPALYIYLCAIALLLSLGLVREQWKAILGSSLFLYDLNIPPWSWHVGHTWTLAVEEQFYLVFPTLLIFLPKRWRAQFFAGVFLLCTAWNLAVVLAGWNPFLWNHARQGFASICCGVLMAIHENRVRGIAARVPGFLAALTALALLAHPVGSSAWQIELYEGLFVPPAIGFLLMFSLGPAPGLRAFLCSPPLQAVGLTSYGVYLWQQLFTAPREYFSGPGQIIPLLGPLMFLIVAISYWLVEKPAIRYGRFLSERARRSGEAAHDSARGLERYLPNPECAQVEPAGRRSP